MDLIVIDFESFYDNEYTLSKLNTEEYVRDPRFETILCGFKINDRPGYWVDFCDVRRELERVDVANNAVLAHHAHFDGLILSHHYQTYPKVWFDTLSMARAVLGGKGGLSLAKLAEKFGIGRKGEEVLNAKGLRRRDFNPMFLRKYGEYCINDCDLEYQLFQKLLPYFGRSELKIIDMTLRMFTEPRLRLNQPLLERYREDVQVSKTTALLRAGVQLADVMSNDKFAAALESLGVVPPTKISPTTGKETYAFAKTDPAMEALAEHPDEDVQALIAARLKNRTTIAESRATRMISMASRGRAPIYLKYSGADQTHRLSGGDKMNWQNLGRGSMLRNAIEADTGEEICVGDSSNIEARVLDWLAMQEDAIEVYRKNDAGLGPDTYCVLAGRIYGRTIVKGVDNAERQMGKTAKLGLGYGMGHLKFAIAARVQVKRKIEIAESALIVDTYRTSHLQVVKLWRRAENALDHIRAGIVGKPVDPRGVVVTCEGGLRLPNGLVIRYPDLQKDEHGEWSYWNGRSREKIYGAKVVENCIAGGTPVLTDRGWVSIENVTLLDLVYDGVDFVPHGGVVFKSVQHCVHVDGVRMTPDHEVLTDEGWKPALEEPQPIRADVWHADRDTPVGVRWEENAMGFPLPMWTDRREDGCFCNEGTATGRSSELRLRQQAANGAKTSDTRHVSPSCLLGVEKHARSLSAAFASGVEKLRRAWSYGMQTLGVVRSVLGRHGADISPGIDAGTHEQQPWIQPKKLYVGDVPCAITQPQGQFERRYTSASSTDRNLSVDAVLSAEAWPVFDILDCGPRHRFVVRGGGGPFIVHNCVQALARIIVLDQTLEIDVYLPVVMSVHDEAVGVTASDDAKDATSFILEKMRVPPVWGPDLPLNSEGGHHLSYGHAKH